MRQRSVPSVVQWHFARSTSTWSNGTARGGTCRLAGSPYLYIAGVRAGDRDDNDPADYGTRGRGGRV